MSGGSHGVTMDKGLLGGWALKSEGFWISVVRVVCDENGSGFLCLGLGGTQLTRNRLTTIPVRFSRVTLKRDLRDFCSIVQ